jgi:hypothetical protein
MKIKKVAPSHYYMYCPACDTIHSFGDWGFNGDYDDKPNVEGSLKTHPKYFPDHPNHGKDILCHLHIRNGQIIYLGDCTHSMVNTTIDLPEFPQDKYKIHDEEEEE